jgi:hypothetical protein
MLNRLGRLFGRGWSSCGRVWSTRRFALSTRSAGRPQLVHARAARGGFCVAATGGKLHPVTITMRMAREGRRQRGPGASATSIPFGAHQRRLRYRKRLARCKSDRLSHSSQGRLRVCPTRHLPQEVPGRHADCPLVLPAWPLHFQFAARSFGSSVSRHALRDRGGRSCRRKRLEH